MLKISSFFIDSRKEIYNQKHYTDNQDTIKGSVKNYRENNIAVCKERYLDHLRHHMKLGETQAGSTLKRNELLQSNTRQNYQLELDRLMNELHRPNLLHSSIEHMQMVVMLWNC